MQSSVSSPQYRPVTSPIYPPESTPYTVATSPITPPGSPVLVSYPVIAQPIIPEYNRENTDYYSGYNYSANIINNQRANAYPRVNGYLQQHRQNVAAVIRNSEIAADRALSEGICGCQSGQHNNVAHLSSASRASVLMFGGKL